MRVLVAASSRHGSTAEIAERIGGALRQALGGNAEVDVSRAEDVSAVDGYDGVILGSAVYMGRWLDGARTLAEKQALAMSARPVWLFSSGPVGDPPRPDEDPVDVAPLVAATRAREHQIFAGRLDRHRLSFGERAVVVAFRAPQGDYRDWPAMDAWAGRIARELRAS